MRSPGKDALPARVRRGLQKLGRDVSIARRKRGLTALTMAERLGVARTTYLKIERGDPSVSMGAYAMALFVLGLGDTLSEIVDPARDEAGLLLDDERLPKRVRPRRTPSAL
jgi:transcriptional regulator with XRE-family HTH domain